MRVERFDDVARFYDRVEPLLMRREAENNFELGLAARLRNEPPDAAHLFAIAQDGDALVAVAMMTPPWPLVVTRGPDAAMDAFARYVHEHEMNVSEVGGVVESANRCAKTLARLSNRNVQQKEMLRIFQLTRVIPPRPISGAIRATGMGDLELVLEWMRDFGRAINESHEVPRERIEQRVKRGEYHLWEDPHPVSIAAWAGPTPNGVRINAVYTPPEFRGRGYASNCVAALTQKMLHQGRKFCFLFTDSANPTSNKIYQQLGYEFVCDWVKLVLVES